MGAIRDVLVPVLIGAALVGFGCAPAVGKEPRAALISKEGAKAPPSHAAVPAAAKASITTPKARKLSEAEARQVLHRLTFGARPGEAEALAHSGLAAWLDEQRYPEQMDDTRGQLALEPFQDALAAPGELLGKFTKASMMGEAGGEPGNEKNLNKMMDFGRLLSFAQMSAIVRQTESRRQLFEVMVDFWSNHFNVYARKGLVKLLAADYVERAIRPHALGKFQDLLLATAQHPAMLVYLDNAESTAPGKMKVGKKVKRGGITENYARELLELHTLGVDGGYTQEDVIGVARILTGWSVERSGTDGPIFKFKERAHDRGEKLVLGEVYPAGGGLDEGLLLLRRLATDPRTGKHLAKKLCARLVADIPPDSCVHSGADAFLKSQGDIRHMLGAIVQSGDFSAEPFQLNKMKSPLEFMVSAIRVLDGKIEGDARRLAKMLEQLGEPLLLQAVPTGYPEAAKQWASAGGALGRMNFAIQLASGTIAGVSVDLERLFPRVDPEALVADVNRVVLSGSGRPETLSAILEKARESENPRERRQVAVALALGSPDFQRQ
ncbi:MAG: DUF1800 domain-containing protein [Polyangiaceae bacterium]|nr:DUF1800 domain-containing protein [Polyangiaceae bacterium]